jgi:hypothetical protein
LSLDKEKQEKGRRKMGTTLIVLNAIMIAGGAGILTILGTVNMRGSENTIIRRSGFVILFVSLIAVFAAAIIYVNVRDTAISEFESDMETNYDVTFISMPEVCDFENIVEKGTITGPYVVKDNTTNNINEVYVANSDDDTIQLLTKEADEQYTEYRTC